SHLPYRFGAAGRSGDAGSHLAARGAAAKHRRVGSARARDLDEGQGLARRPGHHDLQLLRSRAAPARRAQAPADYDHSRPASSLPGAGPCRRSRDRSFDYAVEEEAFMNYALWIVQALLALLFLFAGGMKLVLPLEALTGSIPMPGAFLRFIGVCEVLGGLGLILP